MIGHYLAQVTTVPGPTVHAANMDQYSIDSTSFINLDGLTFMYMVHVMINLE